MLKWYRMQTLYHVEPPTLFSSKLELILILWWSCGDFLSLSILGSVAGILNDGQMGWIMLAYSSDQVTAALMLHITASTDGDWIIMVCQSSQSHCNSMARRDFIIHAFACIGLHFTSECLGFDKTRTQWNCVKLFCMIRRCQACFVFFLIKEFSALSQH